MRKPIPKSVRFQSALPRGERHSENLSVFIWYKFQSALPRGERQPVGVDDADVLHFNPRSREGSDLDGCLQLFLAIGISIRAPARGATVARAPPFGPYSFQSALPRGERRGSS